jgi:AraC-like DNA-binding protein
MDLLAPLLKQINLSAQSFFSGEMCQVVPFDRPVGHIHILKSGGISLTVRDAKPIHIVEPSVLFFPRECPHTFRPLSDKESELLCAFIDLGAHTGSPLATSLPEVLIIPLEKIHSLKPTLDLIFAEAFGQEFGRNDALDRLIEYFLIQILRHAISLGQLQGGIFSALSDPRLKHAVAAMHERPAHAWTLDELADLAGMSRARFAVNFREAVGTTPLDYLTDWRISIAQNLLKLGKPIKSIPSAVGYQSQAAFGRVFTKRIGMPPANWFKQLAES